MIKIAVFLGILYLTLLVPVSASHFITGIVEDSKKGVSSNDITIKLWTNDKSDYITDVIGINGNSGTSNMFLIDCNLLKNPCKIGDKVKLQVDDGKHKSNKVKLIISSAGFDMTESIKLKR